MIDLNNLIDKKKVCAETLGRYQREARQAVLMQEENLKEMQAIIGKIELLQELINECSGSQGECKQ